MMFGIRSCKTYTDHYNINQVTDIFEDISNSRSGFATLFNAPSWVGCEPGPDLQVTSVDLSDGDGEAIQRR